MIPENGGAPVQRRLDFDIDSEQLRALGDIQLQRSLTSVRYSPMLTFIPIPDPVTKEDLFNLFEDGDTARAFRVIAETLKEYERRISELEAKQG